jgi:hypothetical protein
MTFDFHWVHLLSVGFCFDCISGVIDAIYQTDDSRFDIALLSLRVIGDFWSSSSLDVHFDCTAIFCLMLLKTSYLI